MLLVLFTQSYVTQTHIHAQDFPAPIAFKIAGSPGHNNVPPSDDPANCPICQQIAQAGQYVVSAWDMPLLVQQAVAATEPVTVAEPHYDAVSHNWRSRGPPQA